MPETSGLVNSQKYLIVVAGPTAVGKTRVAIHLAKALSADIISADSRQIFKEMSIGTARPSPGELAEVPHHFVGTKTITEEYNAAAYGDEALHRIHTLFKGDKYVLLCGGSGLYIKAVCEGFDDIPAIDAGIRDVLQENYKTQGLSWLQGQLKELDPDYFGMVDQQNPQRLMRGLEVKMGTGMSILSFQKKKNHQHNFTILKIGLELDRSELYQRIDDRVDMMVDQGLFNEALALYPFRENHALQTVGYKEIFDYHEGKHDRDEAIRLIKQNSRRYAKRQLTWFKRDGDFVWFSPRNIQNILDYITTLK